MTKEEWQTKDAPRAMLEFVRPSSTTRQLRHFGAACCRAVWGLLPDDRLRAAVKAVERYAAGTTTQQELAACQSQARLAIRELRLHHRAKFISQEVAQRPPAERDWEPYFAAHRAALASSAVALMARPTERATTLGESVLQAFDLVVQAQTAGLPVMDRYKRLLAGHASVLRCVFGDPFHSAAFEPFWRTEAVVGLTRGILADERYDSLPVLADALEDAGCGNAQVLGHLRGGGPHVRGCWCVDGVLGLT